LKVADLCDAELHRRALTPDAPRGEHGYVPRIKADKISMVFYGRGEPGEGLDKDRHGCSTASPVGPIIGSERLRQVDLCGWSPTSCSRCRQHHLGGETHAPRVTIIAGLVFQSPHCCRGARSADIELPLDVRRPEGAKRSARTTKDLIDLVGSRFRGALPTRCRGMQHASPSDAPGAEPDVLCSTSRSAARRDHPAADELELNLRICAESVTTALLVTHSIADRVMSDRCLS